MNYPRTLLLVICIIFFSLFSLLGLWRHWCYLTSINDLGSFDQVVWMAANGHSLINTSVLSQPINWLGFHFQPVLFLFVLLYKIIPTVNWFIFAQSIALAITAWPIYLIAVRITASEKAAVMWALAYLCNPFLLNAAAWDFHPVSIAVPFLALGLLAVERQQAILLVAVSIVLLACKEHMGLAVAGLGLLYGIRNNAWAFGLGFLILGTVAFIAIVAVVMPVFSVTEQHLMFGENIGQLGRYAWLGRSPGEVIEKIVNEPMFVLRTIVSMGGLQYLFQLLITSLFLPLAGMLWLLPVTADLLVNLLSENPMPRSIFSYHSATLIPVLIVAAIHGGQRLTSSIEWLSPLKVALYAMSINIFLGYVHAPIPLPGARNIWGVEYSVPTSDRIRAIVDDIIGASSVSVQSNVGAHFTQRTRIYRYPEKVGEADFVLLRLDTPSRRGFLLDHHLQLGAVEYLDSITKTTEDRSYGIVFWKDPWLILQHGGSDSMNADIQTRIEQLREKWTSLDFK